MITERHERLILEEYAAAGLQPHRRSDGELVTLSLARKLGTPLLPAGVKVIMIDTFDAHPTSENTMERKNEYRRS